MENLEKVLKKMGEELKDEIWAKSSTYCLIDIAKAYEIFDIEGGEQYKDVNAVVPLKKTLKGLSVIVSGKSFEDYAQLKSGIAVPEWVAEEAKMKYKKYKPKDEMTLTTA